MWKKKIIYLTIFLNTIFFIYAPFEGSVYSSVVFSEILLIVMYLLCKKEICLKMFTIPIIVFGLLKVVSPLASNDFFNMVWDVLYFAQLTFAFVLPLVCGLRCLKVFEK